MFERKYTKTQVAAIVQAGCDRGVKPNRRIVELAAAGELPYTDPDGVTVTLPAFEMPPTYSASLVRQEQRKRAGRLVSPVAEMPLQDGLAAMRRRLVSTADHAIAKLEQSAKTKAGADPDEIRKAARMLREIAALGERGSRETAPDAPGKGPMDDRVGGVTRHGPGADILQDHRGSGTAHDAPPIDIPHTHIGDDGQTAPEAPPSKSDTTSAAHHHGADISAAEPTTRSGNAHTPGVAARAGIAPERVVVGRPALGLVPAQDGGEGLGIGSRGSVARECPERAICECAREMGLSTPRPTPSALRDSAGQLGLRVVVK